MRNKAIYAESYNQNRTLSSRQDHLPHHLKAF